MVDSALVKIVGKENVLDDPAILKEYSGGSALIPGKMPGCVVRPADTGELQEVVRWANDKKVPLVPVSSGPPHFRGGSVPGADPG